MIRVRAISRAALRTPLVVAAGGLLVFLSGAANRTHADGTPKIPRTAAPEGARLYFVTPADGDVVESLVTVKFGLSGMGVAPAGIDHPMTGHHHLLVDTELPDLSIPIPNDDKHRHFGGGHTETRVELTPGQHSLQLLLGDLRHIPHDPPVVSPRITITVK